ncbi:ABC transporter ATP-binding protein [Candidatus Palauibacter sp.]|uniref:ABC transporter ATP-binding protein n=1 Tax=Candidatus Palauibacter sp. TaxID=3101350 RepID=UPI003B01436F
MLEIRNLVKVYPGPVAALQGVSLDVGQGMFGLLGPNGAGKTTLMRIVAGLLEPTSGTVHFNGEDIVADPRRIRRQLGYLPQDFGFYPHLTGESMLRFLLVLKGVEAPQGVKRLAAELLDRVNLSYAAKRKVKGYSGGMRQRLGIAQALAGDPRILVVDEPTAGLDPEERLRFYRLLAELAEDRTVLLSTHIVDDISVLCPRVAIMYDGRFVADTTPAEARGRLAGTIYQGAVAKEDLAAVDRDYRVTQAILFEGRNQVRIHLPEGAPPAGFEATEPTLEDAYLLLAQENGAGGDAAGGDAAGGDAAQPDAAEESAA